MTGLSKKYLAYIASPEWRAVRRRYLARRVFQQRGPHCQSCGQPGAVDVHHKNYKRFGHEYLSDLIALCRACHDLTHSLVKQNGMKLGAATKMVRRKGVKLRMNKRRRNVRALMPT